MAYFGICLATLLRHEDGLHSSDDADALVAGFGSVETESLVCCLWL